jgi:hypothetical protein
MLAFLLLSNESFPQFMPASTQDIPIGNSMVSARNINNTGADYLVEGEEYSKVMVHDGDTPVFAWEVNQYYADTSWFLAQILDGKVIKDPDVVLTRDKKYALVCYELDDEIFMTVWKWLPSPVNRFEEQDLIYPGYTLPLQMDYLPSLAGRRSVGNVFYFYKNEFVDREDMMHRVGFVSNQYLRKTKMVEGDTFDFAINDDFIDIFTNAQNYSCILYDMTGKSLISKLFLTGDIKIILNHLPKGMYILTCRSGSVCKSIRFIK